MVETLRWSLLLAAAAAPDIGSDEHILFYPSLGRLSADQSEWIITVQALVYEPERELIVSAVERAFRGKLEKQDLDSDLFKQRIRPFFHDSERFEVVRFAIADQTYTLRPTASDGRVKEEIRLPTSAPPGSQSRPASAPATGTLKLKALLPDGDHRSFTGDVRLVPPTGLSVISDIDDTIRVSFVGNPSRLFKSTLCEPFRPVRGMPELYRHWTDHAGVEIHYVSGSPWQLYEPLAAFMSDIGFPAGSFHLREFRWGNAIDFDPFPPCELHKNEVISMLFENYPQRRFVLVGDSGERDPEIYAGLARRYPDRVAAVFIRDITDEDRTAPRYVKAFEGVPSRKWHIFTNPIQVKNALPD